MNKRKRRGFTLIELLVVMSVIAILAGTVIVNMQGARDRAKITETIAFGRAIQLQLAANAVGLWNFDTIQQPGNRVLDSSRARNHGTINLGTTGNTSITAAHVPSVAGLGSALSFDGVDDFVNIGTGTDYFPLPSFSICSWVKSPGLASGMTVNGIISLTHGLSIFLDGAGRFIVRLDDGTGLPVFGVPDNLHDNKFHHLCATHNGTYLRMYINGIEKRSVSATWHGTTRWPTNSANIGHENNNPAFHRFNGLIDEVGIYNRALSANEIIYRYAQGLNRLLANRLITKKEFNQRMRISQSYTKNNNQDTITKWDTRNNNQ